MTTRKTIVGSIATEVLDFTAGRDAVLDAALVEADCIGSAAHVAMLASMPLDPPMFSPADRDRLTDELVCIMRLAREGKFRISREDQDVHMAVERHVTKRLGDIGKRMHTARSRNDQVAVDLRLYAKEQLLGVLDEAAGLAAVLVRLGRKHRKVPMVGRTHLQPAMPSSVGLWATAHAEALLDDLTLLEAAYTFNDQCPLGAAAGYGVPVPIDRALTAKLLGFAKPVHNVLYAGNARGKAESVILDAMAQVMVTLSRLAEDLILFSMPEFAYFSLPPEYCTGSSIMPQKRNPDVMELVRGRAARVRGLAVAASSILKGLPGGYNRDLQEMKEPFIEGIRMTRSCLRILALVLPQMEVNRQALLAGFTPEVFAADRALELVTEGMSFRDAYRRVRDNLGGLKMLDPQRSVAAKTHLGAPAGLDFGGLLAKAGQAQRKASAARKRFHRLVSKLLRVPYPGLAPTE